MRCLVGVAQEDAARLAPDFAEALAAFADRRRIDQRQHVLRVPRDQRVEQRLVHVLQIAQEGRSARNRIPGARKRLQPPGHLLLQRADMRRQQAVQVERVALALGERRALVQKGLAQEVEPGQIDFNRIL